MAAARVQEMPSGDKKSKKSKKRKNQRKTPLLKRKGKKEVRVLESATGGETKVGT